MAGLAAYFRIRLLGFPAEASTVWVVQDSHDSKRGKKFPPITELKYRNKRAEASCFGPACDVAD